ncbi:NACHT domain-containing protein [Flavobacterium sp. 245]|uniref:NACHT domain-containing protein n=1 Tax=Flavobacterium sp. 245 TaxID=2512115 RepID=UPI001061C4EA|nr:hypothetical protein [Flavobacterium sp. 245]TDP00323.1 hypothetical protein EV145_106218 [Flavobacterium sp. 245]
MSKKGGDLEILALEFLDKIFKELKFAVVRKRIQLSGTQYGYDNAVEIVNEKYISRLIYSECKDYTTELNYTDAMIKLPQLASAHEKIDLALFISPRKNFTNIFEETKNNPFLENLANRHFRVAFLTPETDVKKYFSLYPEIYKKAYGTEPSVLSKAEREEILNQFDKYIFSSRNLQKIVIDESDKQKYIQGIETAPFHIERTLRKKQEREYDYYRASSNSKTLLSEIQENKKGIILLGNPGYGKTSELRQLAARLWSTRENTEIIPVFKSLKNFTPLCRIEDFLPPDFRRIPKLAVIFDGVDEIENIIDFSSKLREFIVQNSESSENGSIQFIISCRTNIYRKYIKDIKGLDIYFLNEVGVSSALGFLEAKYGLDLQEHKTFDIYKNREILENPFYLDLIGIYYKTHKKILTSKAMLIREFVNSRLDEDKSDKFQNDINFDRERIISCTQKIAFALEAMQKPFLTAAEIKRVAQIDEIGLAKNSFLEENMTGSWSFVLKNIQEYFVASILSELDFEEIIQIIKIDTDTDKVHPTWHNVVTFLLNLITDESLYNALIGWLLDNDFELLFNADSDRITDKTKSRAFQDYFVKNCVDDNLWIADLKSTALFSQCDANIEYLMRQAADTAIHRRARMSALKLLSYMSISSSYLEPIKTLAKAIIKENDSAEDDYVYLVEDAIMLTKSLRINEDTVFFNQIITMLKNRDEKEIIYSIISSTPVASAVENIDYFLEILDKAIGTKPWNSKAKSRSLISTKDNILSLFTRIDNGPVLVKIYAFSIEKLNSHQFKDCLKKEFWAYANSFFKSNKQYNTNLIKIISNAVIHNQSNRYDDDLLLETAESCGIQTPLFDLVLDSVDGNSGDRHFLAEVISEDDFEKVLQKYLCGSVNEEFLHQFRNVLSHKDFDLSKKLEDYIESRTQYIFKDKCTHEQLNENSEYWRTKDQKDFNVLFDNAEIERQIFILYEYMGKTALNYKDIDKFYHRYYKDFELQKKVTGNAKQLLYEILRDNYSGTAKLSKAGVCRAIKMAKANLIQDILDSLPEEKKNNKIKISEDQKLYIQNWCTENTPLTKEYYSQHLIKGTADRNYNYSHDYAVFEAIHKFQKFFRFPLDEELLLDMLWIYSHEKGIETDFLDGIVPIEKVHGRILHNLSNAVLSASNFCQHLKYCQLNDIEIDVSGLDLKSKIYAFLDDGHYYYAGEILQDYFTSDLDTLKEFLEYNAENKRETNRFLYDCIISILKKTGHDDTARGFLIENYSSLLAQDIYTEKELVRKLIGLNYKYGFTRYYELLKDQADRNAKGEFAFHKDEWQNFSNPEALEMLAAVFELCLSSPATGDLFGDHYSPLRISLETIVNICKVNDEKTCIKVLELLDGINVQSLKEQNIDLFHLNRLRNEVKEVHYSHKSKPYQITQVLKIIDQNKILFID